MRALAMLPMFVLGCERTDRVEPTDAQLALPTERSVAIVQQPHPEVTREEKSLSSAQRWYLRLTTYQQGEAREICDLQAVIPCIGAGLPEARMDGEPVDPRPDPYAEILARFAHQRDDLDNWCNERVGPHECLTPLVVAFEGQPIDFIPASADRFAFAPGDPAATAWPTATTPWIAIDLDGDGAITSGAELFGDSSVLPDGKTARNGYEALAALDENRDGVIDRADPKFASLLLWADRDGNRASSPDELRPLSEVITAIPLAHQRGMRCTRDHCEGERGAMQWRDQHGVERTGAVVDVYLPRR